MVRRQTALTTRERVPPIHHGCADNKVVERKEIGTSDEFERMNDRELCDYIRREHVSARGAATRIVGAHGWARDLLRADGLGDKIGGLGRLVTLADLIAAHR